VEDPWAGRAGESARSRRSKEAIRLVPQRGTGRFKGQPSRPNLSSGGVVPGMDYMTTTMSTQQGGTDHSGNVTLLRPDGTPYPGSPFTGGGLPGPWAVVVDGNDNVWISNFAMPDSPIAQLCGVRTETCPPGMNTGDQISPPGGYVGGGLQMQTDIAIDASSTPQVGVGSFLAHCRHYPE